LRKELEAHIAIWNKAALRENDPVIAPAAQTFALNAGLTSKGLGGWRYSFHAGFAHTLPGYTPIVNSTRHAGFAVAVATAKFAGAAAAGPPTAEAKGGAR